MTTHLEAAVDTVEAYASTVSFDLDEFQLAAMAALCEGRSVVVAAPTGAGKTQVAAFAIRQCERLGLRAVYTTPIKALSNQKFADLGREYGRDRVGLLTGDHSIRPDAEIVVMTTEVLRNMLYTDPARVDDLGVVVLDEVHYLQDRYRGGVWEEVIIHLPTDIALVALSATVSNVEEFVDWVTTVRGDTVAVIEEKRPVPLEHHYCFAYGDEMRLMATVDETSDTVKSNRRVAKIIESRGTRSPRRGGLRVPRRGEIIDLLRQREMLPAIYFIFSRRGCDKAVEDLMRGHFRLTSRSEQAAIRQVIDRRLSVLNSAELRALGYATFRAALESGLAAHHAGMVPIFRETVEELFLAGLVKVVFATETLSLGINMPAKTVVIEKITKYTGSGHEPLTPGQYTQLAGRAGRRGRDSVGHAVVVWSQHVSYPEVVSLVSARTFELVSSFRPNYNMAANLVSAFDRDAACHIVDSSFAQYQTDRTVVRLEAEAERQRRAIAGYLERASCEHYATEDLIMAVSTGGGAPRMRVPDSASACLDLGTIVVVRGRFGAVIACAGKSGNRVRVCGENGNVATVPRHRVGFRGGRIDLPQPLRPNSESWRSEVAELVKASRPQRSKSSKAERRDGISLPVCKQCPDVVERQRWLRRARQAAVVRDRLERRISRRSGRLSRRLDSIVRFLEVLGYVDGWKLTSKGNVLSRLYTDADLIAAESLTSGVFDGLGAADLAGLASVLTFESRRTDSSWAPEPPKTISRACQELLSIDAEIRTAEIDAEIESIRELDTSFAVRARNWALGRPLDAVLRDDSTGGDFVRNVKQLIDLCRQLSVASEVDGRSRVADVAGDAAASMWRSIVSVSSVVHDPDDEMASGDPH